MRAGFRAIKVVNPIPLEHANFALLAVRELASVGRAPRLKTVPEFANHRDALIFRKPRRVMARSFARR